MGYPAKLSLSPDDRFFVIGSCLARQMETALRVRGLTVLSTMMACPPSESHMGSEPGHKYNLRTVLQEIAWATGAAEFPLDALVEGDPGRWVDLQVGGLRPLPRERVLEWRAELGRYFARVREADVVILDLCSLDAFYDRKCELMLNMGPSLPPAMRRDLDRFECRVRGYHDAYADIRELREVLQSFGHPVRMLVTVNPMRLEATFRDSDTETTASAFRAAMRAAAEDLAAEFDDIEYVPMLEAFFSVPRTEVFADDDMHVRQDVLDAQIGAVLRTHGIDRPPSEPDFAEGAYLSANPDVAARVRRGELASGYLHWIAEGRAAGRSLSSEQLRLDGPLDPAAMRASLKANVPVRMSSGEEESLFVTVTNGGERILVTDGTSPVYVCYRWFDRSGTAVDEPSIHTRFDEPLMPHASVTMRVDVRAPHLAGEYTLALTLLQSNVAWFDDVDAANGLPMPVRVEAPRAETFSLDAVARPGV